jgi:hypothetical protein
MLIPVLTGRESALETLFPGGSSETGENLYQHWALSRYFNQINASIVKSFTEHMPGNRKVRILEVGAGTGGTTNSVLPLLPPHRVLYTFTDVSEVFFTQAEKKFKDYPFVRYSALDTAPTISISLLPLMSCMPPAIFAGRWKMYFPCWPLTDASYFMRLQPLIPGSISPLG